MIDPALIRNLTASGTAYPLDDFSDREKRVLLSALRAAWARVSASGSPMTNEDGITTLMVDALREIRRQKSVPGFLSTTFETPVRDAKEVNFSGAHPDKMPDIVFRPTGDFDARRAWFVEAKIVDLNHSVADYIGKGVMRFVIGDYAWAMPSAAMVAYNDAAYSMDSKLSGKVPIVSCRLDASARQSVHNRNFLCLGAVAPGDIELVHLWLR